MSDTNIQCPKCDHEFALTDTLAGPLIKSLQKKHQADLAAKDAAMEKTRETISAEREQLAAEKKAFGAKLEAAIEDRLEAVQKEERERALKKVKRDLEKTERDRKDLEARLQTAETQLKQADDKEAALIRDKREMEAERRAMQKKIEQGITQGLSSEGDRIRAEEKQAFDLERREYLEKEKSLQKKIEDLKQRAEQGSQQSQGEVLELELEDLLRREFPYDHIDPVGKGIKGGDVLQIVKSPNGSDCGSILWETKRAKNWSGSWIPKLKQDQRDARADLAIILSMVVPQEIDGWGEIDDVWITGQRDAITLCRALRNQLIAVTQTKIIQDGQATNAEMVYDYLMGPQFKARIQATLDKTKALRDGLAQEKRSLQRLWAAREKQIQIVEDSMSGIAGDLFGIAGADMSEIGAFEPLLLEEDESAEGAPDD